MLKKITNTLLRINTVNALHILLLRKLKVLRFVPLCLCAFVPFAAQLLIFSAGSGLQPEPNILVQSRTIEPAGINTALTRLMHSIFYCPTSCIVYAAPSFQAENLGNLRVEQKDDKIYIYYDIYPVGISTESYYVSIKVSADGGKTYTISPKALEGDFGANVKPGQGKQIIWDVTKDRDVLEGDNFVFVLTASDEGAVFDDDSGKGPTKPSLDKTHTGGLSLQVVNEWGKEIEDYQIEIDGSKIDFIPTNPILTLPAGAKTLKIKAEHYSDKQTTVYIAAGQNKVQKIELMRLRGSIAVTSSPPGADVFIDGKSVGQTNDVFPDFIDGNAYAVKALSKGFVPADAQHITVRGSETVTVHFSLISLPILSLAANVEDYDVYVDASFKQAIKGQTGDITIDNPGKTKIKVVKKGYIDWTGSAELFAGKTAPVEIIMKQRNLLVVISNAEGATVEVFPTSPTAPPPVSPPPAGAGFRPAPASLRTGKITSGKLEIWDIPAGTYSVVVDNGVKKNQINAPVADNMSTTVDVQFKAEDLCKPRETKVCEGNSLYWFDSCLNKGDLIKSCNSDEQCTVNGCAPLLPTGPTGSCVGRDFHIPPSSAGNGVPALQCPSDMCYIPPGEFTMGSPSSEKGREDDETQHKVKISKGFCMKKYEVTQGEWQEIIGNNPSSFKNCGSNCPVEQVSWNDVQDFLKKYNAKNGGGYRLPTEAEWEYAARAGTKTAFYTGEITKIDCGYDAALDRVGWYCGNSNNTTHPVGKKEANAFGLYDMHGNVWEWVQDWYGDYISGAVTDPIGASSGSYRVYRGGSWFSIAWFCRAAFRFRDDAGNRFNSLGFRFLRTVP